MTTNALLGTTLAILLSACSSGAEAPPEPAAPPLPTGPVAISGESKTHAVQGRITPIAMDRVEGLGLENGRILVRGAPANVTMDVPPPGDSGKPNRHWTLVSEAAINGRRSVTFTHAQSVEDFTLELPASEAELHYGALDGPDDTAVVVFAWGGGGAAYWGYVTVARRR